MTPPWITWLVYGVGAISFVGLLGLVAIALCRAAAAGDKALDHYGDRRLVEHAARDEVAIRRERRRSHARNGLGTGDTGGAA